MALQWIIIVLLSFKLHNIHASDNPPPQASDDPPPQASDDPPPQALESPLPDSPDYTAELFPNKDALKEKHSNAQYLVHLDDPECQRRFHLFGDLEQLINHYIRKYVHEKDICPHLNLMLEDFLPNFNLVGDNGHTWSSKQKAKGKIIFVTNNHESPAAINGEIKNILNTFLLQHVGDSYYNIDSHDHDQISKILEYSDQQDTIPQILCLWQADDESSTSYIKSIWTMKTVKWTWKTTTVLQAAIIRCVEGKMATDGTLQIDADKKKEILPDTLLKIPTK